MRSTGTHHRSEGNALVALLVVQSGTSPSSHLRHTGDGCSDHVQVDRNDETGDERARLNGAVFFTDYTDLQVQTPLSPGGSISGTPRGRRFAASNSKPRFSPFHNGEWGVRCLDGRQVRSVCGRGAGWQVSGVSAAASAFSSPSRIEHVRRFRRIIGCVDGEEIHRFPPIAAYWRLPDANSRSGRFETQFG